MVVVDASALAAIAFDDEQAPEMIALLEGEEMHAPSVFGLEMAHATLSRCRRSPGKAERFTTGLRHVLDMPIVLHAVDPLLAFAVASETGLSAYGASYLWLARSLRVPLVTADRKLRAVAE